MPKMKILRATVLASLLLGACAAQQHRPPAEGQRPWEDIRRAMLDCAQQYGRDAPPEDCTIHVDDVTPPDLLGRGLHLAWTGRIPDAREMVEGLGREGASPLVIAILTLETELGAGYLERSAMLLQGMQERAAAEGLPAEMLLAYRVALAVRNAHWPRVLALLAPLGEERIANDAVWLSAYARASAELGRDGELEAMLGRTRDAQVLDSSSYLLASWELSQLRGEDVALGDFRVPGRAVPDDVNLRHAILGNRVGREYDGACTAACDELVRLLQARQWDLQRALSVARSFAFLREADHAGRALAAAPASQRELDALVGYTGLRAWVAVLEANPYQAMVFARMVLQEAPRDLDATWIKAVVAINWEDGDVLAEALDVMHSSAPLSPLFLSLWRGLDAHAGHPGLCTVATDWSRFLDANAPAHVLELGDGVTSFAKACGGT